MSHPPGLKNRSLPQTSVFIREECPYLLEREEAALKEWQFKVAKLRTEAVSQYPGSSSSQRGFTADPA